MTPKRLAASIAASATMLLASPAVAHPTPTFIPADKPEVSYAVKDAAARAARQKVSFSKIILVGDSTTQVNTGWGGAFCSTHVTSLAACVNLGRGGRSTLSFRAEGAWDQALAEARVPGYEAVYILIQFGHNDGPNKVGHSTDLDTEFPDNLRRYVAEARAAGAIPILVTPLTRRAFVAGSLQDNLAPWAQVVRTVAKETGAPLVDLNATSVAYVQAQGPVATLNLFWGDAPPAEAVAAAQTGTSLMGKQYDYTHLGPYGAAVFAKQVAAGLVAAAPGLAKKVVE